jgi:hypothetical protein
VVACCRLPSPKLHLCDAPKERYMAKKKPARKSIQKPAAKPKPARKRVAKKVANEKTFAVVEAHSAHLAKLMEWLHVRAGEMTLADVRREMEVMLSGLDELDEQYGKDHALFKLR